MASQSRRERREYAKQMGLISKKENYNEMVGRYHRSNEAGDYLHTHYLQELRNSQPENNLGDSESEESLGINPFGFLGKK